jgi:hypothetical protein
VKAAWNIRSCPKFDTAYTRKLMLYTERQPRKTRSRNVLYGSVYRQSLKRRHWTTKNSVDSTAGVNIASVKSWAGQEDTRSTCRVLVGEPFGRHGSENPKKLVTTAQIRKASHVFPQFSGFNNSELSCNKSCCRQSVGSSVSPVHTRCDRDTRQHWYQPSHVKGLIVSPEQGTEPADRLARYHDKSTSCTACWEGQTMASRLVMLLWPW